MQSTELSCPHCGSTLNFGVDIMAGTPVECLICMQTFSAAPKPVSVAAPKPTAPKAAAPAAQKAKVAVAEPAPIAKPAAKVDAPTGKPHIASAAVAIAAGQAPIIPKSDPNPRPAPRPAQKSAALNSNLILLVAVAAGLLFVLTAGVALAVWKISGLVASASPKSDAVIATTDDKDKNKIGPNAEKPVDPDENPAAPGAEDPAWKKEKQTTLLKRKDKIFNGGADLEINPFGVDSIPKSNVTGLDQKKINEAIEKGIVYLKKSQLPSGTWHQGGHGVGYASIGGLTLLECGVPANDFYVQRAAVFVRSNIANLGSTYDLSLAVLFLDRLGDPRDRVNIQVLALRLLAGQNDGGYWHYNCTVLSHEQMNQLFAFLQTNYQPNLHSPVGGMPNLHNPLQRDEKFQQDLQKLTELMHGANPNPPKTGVVQPVNPKNVPKGKPIAPNWLRAELQNLPVVQNQGKGKGKIKIGGGAGDNSNTQFALLALWAARRHGVPTDQSILSAYNHFETSQHADGGWGYHRNTGTTQTMTCVGLLGEALGHGTAPEIIAVNPKNPKQVLFKPVLEDPAVQKGLTCLSRYIGEPSKDPAKTSFQPQNLYFLWSVERVAMLYDLRSINGKDWYGWGAQMLVHTQDAGGAWHNGGGYPGQNESCNTCFALLFLRRSNLVQDLTNNLRLHSAIQDAPK